MFLDWVERQKRIQKEKQEAAKRAKMLEDLDDEFGVGNLVQEEVNPQLFFVPLKTHLAFLNLILKYELTWFLTVAIF